MDTKRRRGESDLAFLIRNILMGSAAGMIAETSTIPLDTAKVRMQLQVVPGGITPRYNGILRSVARIQSEEGTFALWNGLMPGL